jgi:intracellular septation protein A
MKKALRLIPELGANFVAPYVVYELMEGRYGDTTALIVSALPPLVWSAYELIKTRRLDAVSILVIAGILFTVVATAMGGSARLIQIRDALVTGAIGCMFLGSLFLEKPIIFYLARATQARNTEEGASKFETLWLRPGVPAVFRLMTAVWGVGLVLQTALMCYLAWIWPISRYLLLSPFISYGIFGIMMAWSLWYGNHRKTLGEARDRAAAAATASGDADPAT